MAHALLWKGSSSVSVHRSSLKGLGLAVVAGLLAGSCYTGPINMRPRVEIEKRPGRLFQATVVDPEGQRTRLEWTTTDVTCPSPADVQRSVNWPVDGWETRAELTVPTTRSKKPFCVWAKATDQYGAVAVDAADGDPENHAPEAKLEHSFPGSVVAIRTPIVFTTSGSKDADPDDVLQTTAWFFVSAPVPTASLELSNCPGADANDKSKRCFIPEFADANTPYVIKALVSDGFEESSATDTFFVSPGNSPIARLVLKTPAEADSYPLGTTFHVSGEMSSDPDAIDMAKVEPIWPDPEQDLRPGSGVKLVECDEAKSKFDRCFRADSPGTYQVSLKVTDGTNVSTPAELFFKVDPESPPCLLETVPPANKENPAVAATIDPEKPTKAFEVVKVRDDLDPYPPSPLGDQTTFRWLVDSGAGYRQMGGDRPSFFLPTDGYQYGQEVSVRLEIFDRVTRAQAQTCTSDFCETSSTCQQRVTWKVKFKL